MSNERNSHQDNFILEEFISNDYTGNKYAISKSGSLSKVSLSKPYKSMTEIFKVCVYLSSNIIQLSLNS
jgi:hypothetical protein